MYLSTPEQTEPQQRTPFQFWKGVIITCLLAFAGFPAQAADGYNWSSQQGKTINVMLNKHPYADAIIQRLPLFEQQTGIKVRYTVTSEETYFDGVSKGLKQGAKGPDVFMTGAYQLWDYASAGRIQALDTYVDSDLFTAPDYDINDMFRGVLGANRWSLKQGDLVGTGRLWALPLGFEANVLMYNKRALEQKGLPVPTTLAQLVETAKQLNNWNGPGSYGVAVRGTKSWATIHPGYMTLFSNAGAKDFEMRNGKLNSVVNSEKAVDITRQFADMVREAGPHDWTDYTWYQVSKDLGDGKAAMALDADIIGFFQNVAGASNEAGNLAWAPMPITDGGVMGANEWVWSIAMNNASEQKNAAWLFMQFFTNREHMQWAAIEADVVNPVRRSVWRSREWKQRIRRHTGYARTFGAVIQNTGIKFTPQSKFFHTTTEWAEALQDIIVRDADVQQRMDELAASINEEVKKL